MQWDAFISHASEDKDFVRLLADDLIRRGLRVWFDETILRVGDSLRRAIDAGLAQSRYGVVVISPSFLEKEWPQRELDGLIARETGEGTMVLPVWHEVDAPAVRRFSPTLADRVATSSAKGVEQVADDLMATIAPAEERSGIAFASRSEASQPERTNQSTLDRSLFLAAIDQPAETTSALLAAGADPNATHDGGATPAMRASKAGSVDVLRVLIEADASTGARDEDGSTALHAACAAGNDDVAKLLISSGADANATNTRMRRTPLHEASVRGHLGCVELLLAAGASVNVIDTARATPLGYGCEWGYRAVIDVLIEHGADVNIAGRHGLAPLHWAAHRGDADMTRLLLASKARIDATSDGGETALHKAIGQGNWDVAEYLVDAGASLIAARSSGETPQAMLEARPYLAKDPGFQRLFAKIEGASDDAAD